MDADIKLATQIADLNNERFISHDLNSQFQALNARALYRELQEAEKSHPLILEVMRHLKITNEVIKLADPYDVLIPGGCNSKGMWSLQLSGDGFEIRVSRYNHSGGAMTQWVDWIGDILTDGIFPLKSDGFSKSISPTSARLRSYNITFNEILDKVRQSAEEILDIPRPKFDE